MTNSDLYRVQLYLGCAVMLSGLGFFGWMYIEKYRSDKEFREIRKNLQMAVKVESAFAPPEPE